MVYLPLWGLNVLEVDKVQRWTVTNLELQPVQRFGPSALYPVPSNPHSHRSDFLQSSPLDVSSDLLTLDIHRHE